MKTGNLLLILGLWWAAIPSPGAPLAVGDAVPVISANDQHGVRFTLTNGVRFVLISTDMGCAKAADQKLAACGAGYLEKRQAVFWMDIHTMPGIARFFAFPKLRKYPQRIILIDSPGALARFPSQPGRLTVLSLTPEERIRKISYWDPETEAVDTCFK